MAREPIMIFSLPAGSVFDVEMSLGCDELAGYSAAATAYEKNFRPGLGDDLLSSLSVGCDFSSPSLMLMV